MMGTDYDMPAAFEVDVRSWVMKQFVRSIAASGIAQAKPPSVALVSRIHALSS
jgi:hypothetical protein